MKKIQLFIAALFCINCCLAQAVVERKNKLTDLVTEKYQTIIQTNKQVKQGVYYAFYDKKTLIATGRYTDDKRTGMWHFFNRQGKQVENYNYDTNKLLYEAPDDSTANIRYIIDKTITNTDLITRPVRLGGNYYGYVPYLRLFKLPPEMETNNNSVYNVILELLVSPGGKLADYKIHIRYTNTTNDLAVLNINTDLIPEEDKTFIAATFNNQPILSRIVIGCYITKYDGIEM